MPLTLEQKYRYRDRILRGFLPFKEDKFVGRIVDLTTLKELGVESYYKAQYEKGLQNGLLSDSDAIKLAIRDGLWQEDWSIETLEKQVKFIKKELQSKQFFIDASASLKKQLEVLQKELDRLHVKHNAIMSKGTARFFANKSTAFYKVDMSIRLKSGHIDGESDYFALYGILENNTISITNIREIARSSCWTIIAAAAKNKMGPIFKDLRKLTFYQEQLVSWGGCYQYIYSHSERPDDFTISDDDLCDLWLSQMDKKENTKKIKPGKGEFSQIFVPSDAKGAKNVYDMNENESRAEVAKTFDRLQKEGTFVG